MAEDDKYILTASGKWQVDSYLKDMEQDRHIYVDINKTDTCDGISLPDVDAILDDINSKGVDEHGRYISEWDITDNHKYKICLTEFRDEITTVGKLWESIHRVKTFKGINNLRIKVITSYGLDQEERSWMLRRLKVLWQEFESSISY